MKISRTKLELFQAKQSLTAGALAERAGMCGQFISTVKTRGTCTPITLQKLAKALNCDPAELIEKEG